MPWMARKAISCGMFWLRPQSAEPIRKMTIASWKIRPATVEVGDLAPERGAGGRGQQVGGDDPGEVLETAEVADDAGQGGADDALVERGQEHAGHHARRARP